MDLKISVFGFGFRFGFPIFRIFRLGLEFGSEKFKIETRVQTGKSEIQIQSEKPFFFGLGPLKMVNNGKEHNPICKKKIVLVYYCVAFRLVTRKAPYLRRRSNIQKKIFFWIIDSSCFFYKNYLYIQFFISGQITKRICFFLHFWKKLYHLTGGKWIF